MGIAASAGYPDGRRGSREGTVQLTRALESVDVFVSADIEDGYFDDPAQVGGFVASLPVAGLNIEDSSRDELVAPPVLAAKIEAIKQHRPEVFVNARVDTYWLGQDATVEMTLDRARAYLAAGADGIFVPGVSDPEVIRLLCAELPSPVNVLAVPGMAPAALGELGVRRISTGSLPYRAALHAALEAVNLVRDGGQLPGSVAYPVLQDQLLRYADGSD